MKSSLLKDSIREIKNTYKRFLSILLIVLLGVGFFAGIRATSPDMKEAVDKHFDEQNMMDIEVISTLGLTDDDIKALELVEGVKEVNHTYSFDATVKTEDKDIVVKVKSMPENINKLILKEGNLPENEDECVVEKAFLSGTNHKIGDYITINPEKMDSSILGSNEKTENNENEDSHNIEASKEEKAEEDAVNNTSDNTDKEELSNEESPVKYSKVKIVGTVQSPEYISRSRGTSKLGSGSVNYYMFLPKTNINMSVYTSACITVDGALELASYDNKYEDLISDAKDKIEEISTERKQARYNEIVNEATDKLNDAQSKYDEEKKKAEDELAEAESKIADAKRKVEDGENELERNRKKAQTEFANADRKIADAERQIAEAKETLASKKEEANRQIKEAQLQLDNLKSTKAQYDTLINQKLELEKQISEINILLEQLSKDPITNADKIQELTASKKTLEVSLVQINFGISTIETTLSQQGIQASNLSRIISEIENKINVAKQELVNAENQIRTSEQELVKNKKELENTKKTTNQKLAKAKTELENAKIEIEENEQKLTDGKKEADEKLEEAQEKLNDAKIQISKIEKPTWYILDRNSNYGYVEYIQDTDRIGNLAKVFPIVFFLVAALISLTSMSRMIEEQRVQIGTLKALGYNKLEISMKYIIYALLATALGSIIGMIIGFRILPEIIYSMYEMMYTLSGITCSFRMDIGLIGLSCALVCTLGATIYTCVKELKEKPANLMLPRAPKPGKRIFLERIGFIWKRLKFTQKVTARNIFRYKKKFLMTIIGVAGCTALIITGFGIRDAVSKMIPSQYGEIFKYDATITLKDDLTNNQINEQKEKIRQEEKVENALACYMKSVEITNIENSQTLNLVVANNNDNFSDFITLKSRTKNETYQLEKDKVIISEKIATLLNIKIGDEITIKDTDDIEKDVVVGGITENYIYHYIYMSSDLFNALYGENSYKPNTIIIKEEENTTVEDEEKLGRKILQDTDTVSGIAFLSNSKDVFGDVMDKMELVVYVLIVAAGLLAFAVLYNLSNVNISERIKELATIKVLGFYDNEVFNYVTKETRILTGIGIFFGLFGGYFLTMFIIKTCELDMLMFDKRIGIMGFVYGIIITTVFAEIINIIVNHILKKISMADSLKSID